MKTVIEMARIAGARDDGNRFEFELRDLEYVQNVFLDTAQGKFSTGRAGLFVHRDQLSQSRAGEIFHKREVQNDFLATVLINESKQLLPQSVDIRFVEDFFFQKTCDGDTIDLFDINPTIGL